MAAPIDIPTNSVCDCFFSTTPSPALIVCGLSDDDHYDRYYLWYILEGEAFWFDQDHVMTNLDSIFKSRDITLPTKVRLVKAMVFPVVMYGSESWTVKKLSTEELMLLNCGVGEDS